MKGGAIDFAAEFQRLEDLIEMAAAEARLFNDLDDQVQAADALEEMGSLMQQQDNIACRWEAAEGK